MVAKETTKQMDRETISVLDYFRKRRAAYTLKGNTKDEALLRNFGKRYPTNNVCDCPNVTAG